jgi:hypothetical protein
LLISQTASHVPPAKTAATPAPIPIFCHVFMGLQFWSYLPSNFLQPPSLILTQRKLQKFPGCARHGGKSACVPSKRACFEVFAREAGILLARGGARPGPTQPRILQSFRRGRKSFGSIPFSVQVTRHFHAIPCGIDAPDMGLWGCCWDVPIWVSGQSILEEWRATRQGSHSS